MPAPISEREWQQRAREIHGRTYDYSQVVYHGFTTPVTLVCRTHGAFEQLPRNHVLFAAGCRACGLTKPRKYTNESFAEKARKTHGDRYDYSKVVFTNIRAKVKLVCRVHGVFEQDAASHLNGAGCGKCKADEASKRLVGHVMLHPKTRTIKIKSRKYVVQSSAEELVLRRLVEKHTVRAQNECPTIEYKRSGSVRNHRPDFYLPDTNRLVEVKSEWSLGLIESHLNANTFKVCKQKAKAAIERGFLYSVVVVRRAQLISLPADWLSWSARKTKRYVDAWS